MKLYKIKDCWLKDSKLYDKLFGEDNVNLDKEINVPYCSLDEYSDEFLNVLNYWKPRTLPLRYYELILDQECNSSIYNQIVILGDLEFLKLLEQKWDNDTCEYAAGHGHFSILQWLHEQGCPRSEWVCTCAAYSGKLDILKWAKEEQNCKWDENTFYDAVLSGKIEIVIYLHENKCPWDEWACAAAAEIGNLPILCYLRQHGCPWDEWTCSNAAINGHLDILKYAREHDCPWDEDTVLYAIEYNHLEILKWAIHNGCPYENDMYDYVLCENIEMLNIIRETGCPLDESVSSMFARRGDLESLKWTIENGCPYNEDTCFAAARCENLHILQWLRSPDIFCPWDERIFHTAYKNDNEKLLTWAIKNGCPCNDNLMWLIRYKFPHLIA